MSVWKTIKDFGVKLLELNKNVEENRSDIKKLTSQLETARAEAESARNLAENAQATADAAQIMAASTDDRIEQLFEKAVFK